MGRVEQLDKAIAKVDRQKAALQKQLDRLNATRRALAERRRALFRQQERASLRQEMGLPPVPVMKKAKVAAAPKAGAARGRPARWPGLCGACMRRHSGETGGPRHDLALCAKTQAHIEQMGAA